MKAKVVYHVYVDFLQKIFQGEFKTLKEARAFMKAMGYQKHSEAWIEKVTK